MASPTFAIFLQYLVRTQTNEQKNENKAVTLYSTYQVSDDWKVDARQQNSAHSDNGT